MTVSPSPYKIEATDSVQEDLPEAAEPTQDVLSGADSVQEDVAEAPELSIFGG